jgi:hypothetical protein
LPFHRPDSIFNNRFIHNFEAVLSLDFNPATLLQLGAMSLKGIVPLEPLPSALSAYNDALDNTYVLSIVMGVVACLTGCGVEWTSIKGKNLLAGGNE